MNGFPGVLVCDLLERLAKRNLDSQLLAEFANEALFETLSRLAFTTGKLPQAAQVAGFGALSDEKFLLVENQSGGDVDGLSGQCSCM